MILLFLEIVCATFLLSCSTGSLRNDCCRINSDSDLDYLNTVSLSVLQSQDPEIVLPVPYVDYEVPIINRVSNNKLGNQLSICPPTVSKNIFHETCLINEESKCY